MEEHMEQEPTMPKPTLADRTRDVAAQAQQKAGEQVRSGIDNGKRRAAGALHGVAQSLLNGTGEAPQGASRYVREAGEQVQRAADWLDQADAQQITRSAEEFARRQPALFIGGAFALGLVAARFIKSSSRKQGAHDLSADFGSGIPLANPTGMPADLPVREPRDTGLYGADRFGTSLPEL
jgi:hypothetical protein